jgi:thymidylate synthase ThyX
MKHSVKVLADSISANDIRLTTLEVVFPRIVLCEFNTHRVFSRNSASSRAIPVDKMIKMVKDYPYIPTHWGKNQKGMSAEVEVSKEEAELALTEWLDARDNAVKSASNLLNIGIHKQITNRLLETWMWQTVIVSSTEWDNFYHLRSHEDAHPEIKKISDLIYNELKNSTPQLLNYNDWHLPLIFEEDKKNISNIRDLIKISTGRCARVSYLTHDGKRDYNADITLHDKLFTSGHMSPMEHVATPVNLDCFIGNFRGWKQYRKTIKKEHDMLG